MRVGATKSPSLTIKSLQYIAPRGSWPVIILRSLRIFIIPRCSTGFAEDWAGVLKEV